MDKGLHFDPGGGVRPGYAAMVYKAKEIDDMWFFDWSGQDDTYKERIYPLTIFKGSREVWKKGLDKVYTNIVNGRYGCYDGNWIDFNKDV